jgi:hypothetical protein
MKAQFEQQPRHTCTGPQCRFLSHEHEEDPSPELAERLDAAREVRREKVRKIRRGING